MWTISLLKKNAWESLKGYYWTAFLVCLLSNLIISMVGGSTGMLQTPAVGMLLDGGTSGDAEAALAVGVLIAVYGVIFVFALAISFATSAFLGNPIFVGQCSFFRKARLGDVDFGYMFEGFSSNYMNMVKVMFLRLLYTFLWSMLFVIPGIIKGLEYTLIPYLLTENPGMSAERAFEISRRTMNGEKGKCFLFQLSFIGWFLLGVFACGLGVYFVLPYYQAGMTEFYACMRAKAIAQGITSEEELSGVMM